MDKPPKVLLIHQHSSYIVPDFTIKATAYNIHLYPFPRHLTYILQPLNVEAEYTTRLAHFRRHLELATQYVEDTWLIWKEKLVDCWVSAHFHFGIRFTSSIEGCHAMLKAYLQKSTGDLKGVFDNLFHFWPDQHRSIHNSTAQEQNQVKHCLNKTYFHMVKGLVHNRALFLILAECVQSSTKSRKRA
jgi:hypothetical protein